MYNMNEMSRKCISTLVRLLLLLNLKNDTYLCIHFKKGTTIFMIVVLYYKDILLENNDLNLMVKIMQIMSTYFAYKIS